MTSQSNSSSNSLQSQGIFSKIYLPFELIEYIQEYTNINNLLITCKSFDLFRFELFKWKLTREASYKKYYNNISFRHTILSRMKYPHKQLLINLSDSDVEDVSSLSNVHDFNLSHCFCITDVSALSNVHTLKLFGCTGITDVSALGNVHNLDLSDCPGITDVSSLGNVHTLNCYGCTGVNEVVES